VDRRRLTEVGGKAAGRTRGENAKDPRELLLAYLGAQLDELRVRESGARVDGPDAVHRMRVASRRLRSSLATFGPLFAGSQAQDLRDELLWLGAELGPVRDVEVLRARLHETAAMFPPDAHLAEALAVLDHELAERHSRSHDALVQALDSPRYAALLADLTEFLTRPPWARGKSKAGGRPALPSLVGRACARVDRAAGAAEAAAAVDGVLGVGGPELHEVRKAAKRARYAAEVVAPSAGSPAHALAHRMEDLQEVLGRHQDSLMARRLLQDLAGRMPQGEAFALGLLTGVERASDESVRSAYRQALAAASEDEVRGWTSR